MYQEGIQSDFYAHLSDDYLTKCSGCAGKISKLFIPFEEGLTQIVSQQVVL